MRPLGNIVASLGIVAGIIMASSPAQARDIVAGHGEARRGPTYPTQHVNEIYVSVTKTRLIKNASDARDIATRHYTLVVFLSVRNANDVIVHLDPSWFTATDSLDQPLTLDDECSTLSGIDSENTRIVQAFYPRLCTQDFIQNYNGNINPRMSVGGSISFDVPDGQHSVHLIWTPQGAMAGNITWPIKTWTFRY